MHVESSAPARLRVLEVTPARFRALAFAAAAALYVIVSTGATVRLTGSGLGCEHWPGCQPGNPFPEKGYHSYIEFGNRMVAGTTIVLTFLAWLASRRTDGLPRWTPRLALAARPRRPGGAPSRGARPRRRGVRAPRHRHLRDGCRPAFRG